MTRIAVIHATILSHQPIAEAFQRLWPEAITTNLTDDSLSADLAASGDLNENIFSRIADLVGYAVNCGAQGILFSCSGFGAAIDAARQDLDIPVLKPDEAMIDDTLSSGTRIAGLATFLPTVRSLRTQLELAAARRNLSPRIQLTYVPGALKALQSGRLQEHDALILQAAKELSGYDVLVLAQFSMARAYTAIRRATDRPVLTSPHSAVSRLRSFYVDD
ncbi:MAG: aspartate/glutamate racemase family protein [Gammaproteobacteria bacterium]|nr:aspartate/glutamate racemase family protein [Gammaproteobacteria bacterium]